MLQWCAYCQTYQGEGPPYENHSLTHTICDGCVADGAFRQIRSAVLPILSFFQRVRESAILDGPGHRGLVQEARAFVREGSRLGIAPVDLLLGLLQPALYDVGVRWEQSPSIADEGVRLAALCREIVSLLLIEHPQLASLRRTSRPSVLLAAAQGNFHTLGLQIAEFVLLSHKISVMIAPEDSSGAELAELVRTLRPRLLGVSVALREQLGAAESMLDEVRCLPLELRPQLCIGGYAARTAHDGSALTSRYPLAGLAELLRMLSSDAWSPGVTPH
jgi:methanogenic corrinoid protein MtbC1